MDGISEMIKKIIFLLFLALSIQQLPVMAMEEETTEQDFLFETKQSRKKGKDKNEKLKKAIYLALGFVATAAGTALGYYLISKLFKPKKGKTPPENNPTSSKNPKGARNPQSLLKNFGDKLDKIQIPSNLTDQTVTDLEEKFEQLDQSFKTDFAPHLSDQEKAEIHNKISQKKNEFWNTRTQYQTEKRQQKLAQEQREEEKKRQQEAEEEAAGRKKEEEEREKRLKEHSNTLDDALYNSWKPELEKINDLNTNSTNYEAAENIINGAADTIKDISDPRKKAEFEQLINQKKSLLDRKRKEAFDDACQRSTNMTIDKNNRKNFSYFESVCRAMQYLADGLDEQRKQDLTKRIEEKRNAIKAEQEKILSELDLDNRLNFTIPERGTYQEFVQKFNDLSRQTTISDDQLSGLTGQTRETVEQRIKEARNKVRDFESKSTASSDALFNNIFNLVTEQVEYLLNEGFANPVHGANKMLARYDNKTWRDQDMEKIELLLKYGLNPKQCRNSLLRPGEASSFAYYMLLAQNEKMTQLLIKALQQNGGINSQDQDGLTALHIAIKQHSLWPCSNSTKNQIKNIETLLDAGADVNVATDSGDTPLKLTADLMSEDIQSETIMTIMEMLMKKGADSTQSIAYAQSEITRITRDHPDDKKTIIRFTAALELLQGKSRAEIYTKYPELAVQDAAPDDI